MVCNKNCFRCEYEDCVCDDIYDYSDIEDVDRELDKEIGYLKSCYNGTLKTYKANHSESGRMARIKYAKSEKGKENEKRKMQKKIASGRNAEACRRYRLRQKIKAENEMLCNA